MNRLIFLNCGGHSVNLIDANLSQYLAVQPNEAPSKFHIRFVRPQPLSPLCVPGAPAAPEELSALRAHVAELDHEIVQREIVIEELQSKLKTTEESRRVRDGLGSPKFEVREDVMDDEIWIPVSLRCFQQILFVLSRNSCGNPRAGWNVVWGDSAFGEGSRRE